MRILFFLVVLCWYSLCAGQLPKAQFGFQGIMLNSDISELPRDAAKDCWRATDPRYKICWARRSIADVQTYVEFSFDSGVLTDIEVYFDSEKYVSMAAALEEKYGRPDSLTSQGITIWNSAKSPIYDMTLETIALRRVARDMSSWDEPNFFVVGRQYSSIEYSSMALSVANTTKQRRERAKGL
jgi:hypothetical protein